MSVIKPMSYIQPPRQFKTGTDFIDPFSKIV